MRAHLPAVRWRWFVTLVAALAGCSNSETVATVPIPADRPGTAELPPAQGTGEIDLPVLPSCLKGESPTGCHAPPELPDCLQGVAPEGCAVPPSLEDWTCPVGWDVAAAGENEPWEHAFFGHFVGEHAPGGRNRHFADRIRLAGSRRGCWVHAVTVTDRSIGC